MVSRGFETITRKVKIYSQTDWNGPCQQAKAVIALGIIYVLLRVGTTVYQV